MSNKIKLVESVSLQVKKENIVSVDSTKLIEAQDGKPYNCRGILKNVPISKYTENANGRVYSRKLWENVKKQGIAEGTVALADHPEDDGSVINIAAVWKNLQLHKDFVTADCFLVGELGQTIFEAVQAGAKQIGLSSVGFGELSEADGKTVNPDTYELQRTADFVLNPSQGTFASYENIVSEFIQITEHKDNIQNIIKNNNTNKLDNEIIKEHFEEKNDMREKNIMNDKIQIANLKNYVRTSLKEAQKNTNFKEAIEDLVAVKEGIPIEMSDQISKVDEAISVIQEKMENEIKQAKSAIEEKDNSVKQLSEKVELADKAIAELKDQNKKLKAIIEKSQDSKQIDILQESFETAKSDINQMMEDRENMEADIAQLLEDRKNMLADITEFQKERKALKESKYKKVDSKKLKIAEAHIKKLEKILEDEYGYEFDDTEDPYIDPMNDEGMSQTTVEEEEMDDYNQYEAYDDSEFFSEEEDDDEDEEDSEEMEEAEENEEEDDEENEEDKSKEKKDMKESSKIRKDVLSYYKEAVQKEPALKDLKNKILKSKSLYEATQHVVNFKTKSGKDMMSLKESKKLPELELFKFER